MTEAANDNRDSIAIEELPEAELRALVDAGYLPVERYAAEMRRRRGDETAAPRPTGEL